MSSGHWEPRAVHLVDHRLMVELTTVLGINEQFLLLTPTEGKFEIKSLRRRKMISPKGLRSKHAKHVPPWLLSVSLGCSTLNMQKVLWSEWHMFICWNPKSQHAGIRRWGLWEVVRLGGGNPRNEMNAFIKETLQNFSEPSPCGVTARRQPPTNQEADTDSTGAWILGF